MTKKKVEAHFWWLFFSYDIGIYLGLHESETIYNIYVIIASLLEILESFSIVLVFSSNMKSIIYCLEIFHHIGVTQTCDKKRLDCLKN